MHLEPLLAHHHCQVRAVPSLEHHRRELREQGDGVRATNASVLPVREEVCSGSASLVPDCVAASLAVCTSAATAAAREIERPPPLQTPAGCCRRSFLRTASRFAAQAPRLGVSTTYMANRLPAPPNPGSLH
jgi:hypothetical protein